MAAYSDTNKETEIRLKHLTVKVIDQHEDGIFSIIYVEVVAQSVFTSHVYAGCEIKRKNYIRKRKQYIQIEDKESDFDYRIVSSIKYEKDFLTGFKFWINESVAKKYLTFI
jgi:hypothetical protein